MPQNKRNTYRAIALGIGIFINSGYLSHAENFAENSLEAELAATSDPVAQNFSISGQTVADALILFAEQSGEQIIFRFTEANRIPARDLTGNYPPIEALLFILKDTGFKAYRNLEGTIVVQKDPDYAPPASKERSPSEQPPSPDNGTLPPLIIGPYDPAAAPQKPEEIVITGSRIRRQEYTSPTLVSIVKGETITRTGTSNIEDLLNKLPQIVPALTGSSNNPGDGIATVDMRGLGADRTLVLLNGRRYVPSSQSGLIDLNTIPTFLIDKIEVATGGTSAVYGADAVAGVVNFKLREDIEGFEGLARYRTSHHGDGQKYDLNLVYGQDIEEGRGNVFLHLGFLDRNPIMQGDRDFSSYALYDGKVSPGSNHPRYGYGTPLDVTLGGVPGLIRAGSNNIPEGLVLGLPGSGPHPGLERFGPNGEALSFDSPVNAYNYAPFNFLQLPQRQVMATFGATYQVTENLEIYNQVIFSNNKVDLELAPAPITLENAELLIDSPFLHESSHAALRGIDWYGTGDIWQARDGNGVPLVNDQGLPIQARQAVTMTYNPDGTIASKTPLWAPDGTPIAMVGMPNATEGGASLYLADGRALIPQILRRISETGSRQIKNNRQTINAVLGLQGNLTADWNFAAHYNYSRYKNTSIHKNAILDQNLSHAVNIIEQEGTYICQDATARHQGCVPANIFGAGNLSPEAVAYITTDQQESTVYTRQDATFYVDGTFDHGLHAPVNILLGLDWRKENSSYTGIPNPASGFVTQSSAEGAYTVFSLFNEVKIPLIAQQPGFQTLEVSGAVRYSDYSTSGSVWTFAAGINWQPVTDLRIRSQYQRAVREPSIDDLYTTSSDNFPSVHDTCARHYTSDGAIVDTSHIQDICAATGVPAHLVGQYDQLVDQVREVKSGNVNLQAEKSNTFTLGLIYQPHFLPGLHLAFDYYHIALNNVISSYGDGANGILRRCYDAGNSQEEACQKITRYSSGRLKKIDATLANSGQRIASGLDGQLHYTRPLTQGIFGANEHVELILQGSYSLSHRYRPTSGDEDIECAGYFSGNCKGAQPRFRLTQLATWGNEALELSVRWRHIGGIYNKNTDSSDVAVPYLAAKNYMDSYVRYRLSDGIILRAGVDNIFNITPDFVGNGQQQANTFPSVYDTLGAYFHFGINVFY